MTRISLLQALTQWHLWPLPLKQAPSLIEKVPNGLTNENFLIKAQGKLYKLRINSPYSAMLGIDRTREHAICDLLAPFKVAPKLIYSSPNYTYSVFEWIDGRTWTKDDFEQPQQVKKLLDLVKKFQTIDTHGAITSLDYAKHLNCYYVELQNQPNNTLISSQQLEQYRKFAAKLDSAQASPSWPPPLLTHHDITADNIIEGANGPVLIDWEYAAMGHPHFDALCINKLSHSKEKLSDLLAEMLYWVETFWYALNDSSENKSITE